MSKGTCHLLVIPLTFGPMKELAEEARAMGFEDICRQPMEGSECTEARKAIDLSSMPRGPRGMRGSDTEYGGTVSTVNGLFQSVE